MVTRSVAGAVFRVWLACFGKEDSGATHGGWQGKRGSNRLHCSAWVSWGRWALACWGRGYLVVWDGWASREIITAKDSAHRGKIREKKPLQNETIAGGLNSAPPVYLHYLSCYSQGCYL
jgi:hypothetical protein